MDHMQQTRQPGTHKAHIASFSQMEALLERLLGRKPTADDTDNNPKQSDGLGNEPTDHGNSVSDSDAAGQDRSNREDLDWREYTGERDVERHA